jgi:hypothetical protein
VAIFFNGARSVRPGDFDGDGDIDVLGACSLDDRVVWWENAATDAGIYWTEHTIDPDFDGATCVWSDDIDGDGDIDALGTAEFDDDSDISWWENVDGSGQYWNEHVLDRTSDGLHCVHSADLSGDGFPDVIGSAPDFAGDDLRWWDLARFESAGALESSLLYTCTAGPNWGYLQWDANVPGVTSIGFQLRSSETAWGPSMPPWSDTLWVPCSLEGILTDGDYYVQYRAILLTSNPDIAPVLNEVSISWDPLGVGGSPPLSETSLIGALPNPSRDVARIGFVVAEPATVDLEVFDLTGRLLEKVSHDFPAGQGEVLIPDLPAGVYLVRMVTGDFFETERFAVIR